MPVETKVLIIYYKPQIPNLVINDYQYFSNEIYYDLSTVIIKDISE